MGLLKGVSVQNFRSAYDVKSVDLDDELTVIVGPNGAGKSNFLQGVASFGTSNSIEQRDLSDYGSAASAPPSSIPITSIRLDATDNNIGAMRTLRRRPSLKSVEIRNDTILTAEGEFEELEGPLPTNPKEIKLIQFANGTYRILTNDGRYNVETAAEKRQSDLRKVTQEIIRQAVSIGLVDSVPNKNRIDSSAVADVLDEIDETLDSEDIDIVVEKGADEDPGASLIPDIYDDLEMISDELADIEALLSDLTGHLPTFVYYDQVPAASDGVRLSELDSKPVWSAFLKWGGLDSERVRDVHAERRQTGLERAGEELTRYLNSYLYLDEPVEEEVTEVVKDPLRGRYTVTPELESEHLMIYILDEEENTRVQLTEKSTGFRCLISYLTMLFANDFDGRDVDLFVVDDIGIHLHPDWKINLRRALHGLTSAAQIVYSTHSPFLIDNNSIDQVRIVSNRASDPKGSSVRTVSEARGSQYVHDQLEPLRSSLGARVADFLFGASGTVILEGETDKEYIQYFADLFESDTEFPSLDDDIKPIIGKGSQQSIMANFLEVEEPNYLVIMDKDDSGNAQKSKIEQNGISGEKVLQLDSAPNQSDGSVTEIEDLFPVDLVCEGVAAQYPSPVSAQELEFRVNSTSRRGVFEPIRGRLHQYEGEGDISDSDGIAKSELKDYILDQIDESWLSATGPEKQTVEDFKYLINTINDRLARGS